MKCFYICPIAIIAVSGLVAVVLAVVIGLSASKTIPEEATPNLFKADDCSTILSDDLRREIQSYAPIVDRIVQFATVQEKGETIKQLADFVDTFGPRLSGSSQLEKAIDDRVAHLKSVVGESAVHTEDVQVPRWIRGDEEAHLITAWEGGKKKMSILSLGASVATPKGGITAEAIVVKSFDELAKLGKAKVKGKIVVYNQDWVDYGTTVKYRVRGASEAAKLGGVAALIRSVTPYSLNTPHTGAMSYEADVIKVPGVSITVEDAELLYRKQLRGEKLTIFLRTEARMEAPVTSRNTIAELRGVESPDEHVVVSGHIDSWDVGQGAMDDGGGAAISWRVPEVLKKLGLTPRRTIRTVLFTAEEVGIVGGTAYFQAHKANASNVQYIMESDSGTFKPLGLSTAAKDNKARCIVAEALKLLSSIEADKVSFSEDGPDISKWFNFGVPGGALTNANEKYFYYHHTDADMINLMNPDDLDKATAVWTSMAYVFAQLSERIPHHAPYPKE